jgi:RNA polymerase subunit RPABC4/transcription elongation factor Spt4
MVASIFILATCLLPVVSFLALIYFDQTPYLLRQRRLKRGSYLRCPQCAAIVPGQSVVCPNCEASFAELVAPIRAYRPGYEAHTVVAACIRCGRLNGPKWTACKSCGTPLERPAHRSIFKSEH